MKKLLILIILLIFTSGALFAAKKQKTVTVDQAVTLIAESLDANKKMVDGINVAILKFSAPQDDIAKAVNDKMIAAMIKTRFNMIDASTRVDLQKELAIGESEEFDPSSASQFGKMLNAKSVIFGTVVEEGKSFTLTVKVLDVETAAIQAMEIYSIKIPGLQTQAKKESSARGAAIAGSILGSIF